MATHIPLMMPYVPREAITAVADTLNTRWIGQGPKVDAFEKRFSEQIAIKRDCIATGSCTDALHLAYLLAGIGPGDEVIAPVFTCTATNLPLLWIGATIRFADVEPDSLNIDPAHVGKLVTEKTKAVVAVHYGGEVAHMAGLRSHGIPVIEDCAQALGARFRGLPVGSHSDYACFSFQAVKHVTTGDGGMLVVPDGLGDQARRMRWFGIDRQAKLNGTWANDITEIGYKYQMTDIAAGMGIAGLDALEWQLAQRRVLLQAYSYGLCGIPGLRHLGGNSAHSAAWLCTVLVDHRDGLRRKLSEHGIESDPVHYRNDRYSIFAKFRQSGEFPNMDAIEDKYLCLPLHMGMIKGDVERICGVIRTGW